VLRYDPPVQMNGRHTTADVRVASQVVPAGDRIVMLLAAGNRDPRRFADPDRFWPERPDNAHLAFGGGVHYCLGAALARMEGQAALTAIATRLSNPRLVVDPPLYRPNTAMPAGHRVTWPADGVGRDQRGRPASTGRIECGRTAGAGVLDQGLQLQQRGADLLGPAPPALVRTGRIGHRDQFTQQVRVAPGVGGGRVAVIRRPRIVHGDPGERR
jgi:Cytochrome P450